MRYLYGKMLINSREKELETSWPDAFHDIKRNMQLASSDGRDNDKSKYDKNSIRTKKTKITKYLK
jgi:hypothetical protein